MIDFVDYMSTRVIFGSFFLVVVLVILAAGYVARWFWGILVDLFRPITVRSTYEPYDPVDSRPQPPIHKHVRSDVDARAP